MELSQRVRTNLLFDFYGLLLTERQKEFVKLYFCDDLSLGEIAQRFRISRQAVYDTLKKARESLEEYEKKLSLARELKRRLK
ncbi:YlxM family DNA-binding protein [bacterium]|nr:YlxM family DNA-binding protein [bacterium]